MPQEETPAADFIPALCLTHKNLTTGMKYRYWRREDSSNLPLAFGVAFGAVGFMGSYSIKSFFTCPNRRRKYKEQDTTGLFVEELCEELALANNIRDFSDNHEELEDGFKDVITYSVKYLGNTTIPTPRSESSTGDAVKRIITAAKGNKKLQRVTLSISPKGIEMLDVTSGETLLQVSIYNISYCSADSAHDHVFAFVGTTTSPEAEVKEMCFRKDAVEVDFEGPLVCYAFLCQKRKMAQTVTLTVARSFERAYQIWQNKQFHAERKRKELAKLNASNRAESASSSGGCSRGENDQLKPKAPRDESDARSLLIDFNSELTAEICSKDHRDLLQNTWVSFDDDHSPQEFFTVPNLSAANGWSRTAICSN